MTPKQELPALDYRRPRAVIFVSRRRRLFAAMVAIGFAGAAAGMLYLVIVWKDLVYVPAIAVFSFAAWWPARTALRGYMIDYNQPR